MAKIKTAGKNNSDVLDRIQSKNKSGAKKTNQGNDDLLWRKPIALETSADEDPLEALYRGREVAPEVKPRSEVKTKNESKTPTGKNKPQTVRELTEKIDEEKSVSESGAKAIFANKDFKSAEKIIDNQNASLTDSSEPGKLSVNELKTLLKIKGDGYNFTDVREILRGKSFEMYAYLKFLAGEAGVCKIKHQDLMKKLEISRPTLFKQGDWLVRLSLIEKRNVPGDHLGTSYTVRPIEAVLPVPSELAKQVQNATENYQNEN